MKTILTNIIQNRFDYVLDANFHYPHVQQFCVRNTIYDKKGGGVGKIRNKQACDYKIDQF